MLIDVKFEQVFTHQILNLPLIALDLVLHSNSLSISVLVEPSPDSLNFLDPNLVCSVRIDMRNAVISIDRHKMLKSSHVILVYFLAEDLVSNLNIRQLSVNLRHLKGLDSFSTVRARSDRCCTAFTSHWLCHSARGWILSSHCRALATIASCLLSARPVWCFERYIRIVLFDHHSWAPLLVSALTIFGAIHCIHKLPLHSLVIELELIKILENLWLLSLLRCSFYSRAFYLLLFVFL